MLDVERLVDLSVTVKIWLVFHVFGGLLVIWLV